eukprot:3864089-Rhodomonas_salina.1
MVPTTPGQRPSYTKKEKAAGSTRPGGGRAGLAVPFLRAETTALVSHPGTKCTGAGGESL